MEKRDLFYSKYTRYTYSNLVLSMNAKYQTVLSQKLKYAYKHG